MTPMDPVDLRVSRVLLLARAAVLAAVTMLTGTAAHVSADGRLPGVLGLGAIAGLTLVVAARLLSHPASTRRVVALTVGAQSGVHVLLTASAGHAVPPTRAAAVAHAHAHGTPAHSHHGLPLGSTASAAAGGSGSLVPEPVLHVVTDLTGAHAPMMVVHLLAAALVGVWLAVGERALWTLVCLAAGVLVPRVPALAVAHAPVRAPVRPADLPWRRTTALLARVADRRGPPALFAV